MSGALPIDAIQADLGQFDIVVNATGEEALGHLLVGKPKNRILRLC